MAEETSPLTGLRKSDVESRVEATTSKVIETVKHQSNTVVDKVKRITGTTANALKILTTNPRELVQSVLKIVLHIWHYSPFFRWFLFIAGTFTFIPAVVLVGWIVLTCAIVVGIAGIGIFMAEGFFAFLGGLVFFPVVGFLLFVASIGGLFASGTFIALKVAVYLLGVLGLIDMKWEEGTYQMARGNTERGRTLLDVGLELHISRSTYNLNPKSSTANRTEELQSYILGSNLRL
ncbi:12240_t:CDS:2 [Ambispora gerdemannii]|uniref:12240_t:CDS:1 n=1 Tax=Ambispora gerdemannii TaxID=144530 RepID=A0A9N8Z553_9GLOM|nr:12240_t:CDS:2 [Ambispora gerdemannii]